MDKFCKFCGVAHTAAAYPKTCEGCAQVTYINPTPVAVLIRTVYDAATGRRGVLVGRRTIDPGKGLWGLVGGFMDPEDFNFEHAMVRELEEETGLLADPDTIQVTHTYSDGRHALVFGEEAGGDLLLEALEDFVPCAECDAIRVAWEPEKLCFQSHTEALRRWFAKEAALSRSIEILAKGVDMPQQSLRMLYNGINAAVREAIATDLDTYRAAL